MSRPPVILWFRQDLRLANNPALIHAAALGPVIPVYILDDISAGDWAMGAASRVWLHHSLEILNESVGGQLLLMKGDALKLLPPLVKKTGAAGIFWNRCYEPWRIQRDKAIKAKMQELDIEVESFNAGLLREPWNALKDDDTPYRVFTPFFKNAYKHDVPRPEPAPKNVRWAGGDGKDLNDLGLLPAKPRWDKKFDEYWDYGEEAAQKSLRKFLDHGLKHYNVARDRPDKDGVSRLSPHLHWGEISPRQVWHDVQRHMAVHGLETDGHRFLSELAWREFCHNLLYYNPQLPDEPLQARFAKFPWHSGKKALRRWQQGMTGYPVVDAGMRQLWETGYMHNRVRMIVGSFLVKDLLLPWQEGERWFWDCLVDADLANNSANWQWVAGCGADAAPYFRVFNPVTQGKKFDPHGDYVRRYVPELANLPEKIIHEPWEADDATLKSFGVVLGKDYPEPIVNHKEARDAALAAFKGLRTA